MILNYVFAVAAMGIAFMLSVWSLGGLLRGYVDSVCLLITVVFPLIYQWALFGFRALKNAFTAGFRKDVSLEDLDQARLFFKSYAKVVWFSALSLVIIGMVAMLRYLEDRSALGPNMAMTLLSILYAAMLQIIVFIPFSVILNRRINESAEV
ncbi:MAG: hypothetical protein LBH85_08830 [Treponema sp.]|jgi:hypothetical protein|nr:hypothetical protein [Treponema sp.]